MNERVTGHKIEWKKWKGSPAEAKPLNRSVLRRMTTNTTTFLQIGPIGVLIHDIKKALHPDKEIPYDNIPF